VERERDLVIPIAVSCPLQQSLAPSSQSQTINSAINQPHISRLWLWTPLLNTYILTCL